jgi:hypothetical protein
MNERWVVPIMVAVVGLAGGLGGSYLGGRSAHIAQREQFESQREAEVQDLAIAAYSKFVQTAARIAFSGREANDAERAQVFAAEAQIAFLFQEEEEVKRLARELRRLAISNPDEGVYRAKQKEFNAEAGRTFEP